MFSAEQKAALEAPLSASRVKSRAQAGRNLSYIEGWWAIAEANRIFGFDGWTRETIDLKCVSEKPRKIKDSDGWGVTYIARVRIMVGQIIREGCGTGHGVDRDLGQAHESALKEAETDAMKRALMTFGNPFGLALYDKEQVGVEHDTPHQKPAVTVRAAPSQDEDITEGVKNWVRDQKAVIDKAKTLTDVLAWQDDQEANLHRLFRKAPTAHREILNYFQLKQTELSNKMEKV
jgi:DNA recombination protein Rad52